MPGAGSTMSSEPWQDKVDYLRPEEIVDLPPMPGWVGQQVLKLLVHQHVTSEYYVVLDAKNHWNQTTDHHTFVNPDGRARGASHTYRGHALEAQGCWRRCATWGST